MNQITQGNIQLIAAPRPFAVARIERALPAGGSLTELLAAGGIVVSALTTAHVFVGDVLVPAEYWPRVRPKPGQTITVRVVPQGGGDNKTLRFVLTLAVIAAAAYTGGAAAGGLGLTTTSAAGVTTLSTGGLIVSGVVGAAVSTAGMLAINAIAPPSQPQLDTGRSLSASPSFAIEGARNQLRPFAPVPRLLGRHRIFPPFAAKPYTEIQGNEQYLNALFLIGYGTYAFEDFKIGETPLERFENAATKLEEVELEILYIPVEATAAVPLLGGSVDEQVLSIELKQSNGFVVRTTEPDTSAIVIDLTFPQGLVEFDRDSGDRTPREVLIEVEWAPAGTNDWSIGLTPTAFAQRELSGIEPFVTQSLTFGQPRTTTTTRRWRVLMERASGAISLQQTVRRPGVNFGQTLPDYLPPPPPDAYPLAVVTAAADGVITTADIMDEREGTGLFINTSTTNDFAVVPSATPDNKVVVQAGDLAFPVTVTGQTPSTIRRSVRVRPNADNPLTVGQYDVRLRRHSADSADDRVFDKVYWTSLRSVKRGSPVHMRGITLPKLRIKASGQLNGVTDEFNCVATSILPDYDAAEGAWLLRPTNNPASIYLELLRGRANARPLTEARIDRASLEAWHTVCASRGLEFNMYVDFQGSLAERLRDVAAAGRAAPAIRDGKYGVIQDRLQAQIIQHFTPRNSWGFEGTKIFSEPAHAMRVRFVNALRDWRQDEHVVYDDGYDALTATRYETLELPGVTRRSQINKLTREHMATARLRPEQYAWNADLEHIVCTRGDLVRVTHDVPLWGLATGRVKGFDDYGAAAAGLIREADDFSAGLARWAPNANVTLAIVAGQLETTQAVGNVNGDATFDHVLSADKRITVRITVVNDVAERGFRCGGVYARRAAGNWQFPSGTITPHQPPWSSAWRFELYPGNTIHFYAGDQLVNSGVARVSGVIGTRTETAAVGTTQLYDDLSIDYLADGVTLDEACPMEAGKAYAARMRRADGESVYRNVVTAAGEQTTLTFVNGVPLAEATGALVQFGEQSAESVELIIKSITPGADLSARITAVDHAPGIFTAAFAEIPDFDPQITAPPGELQPVIDTIRSGAAVLVRDDDGSLRPRILVSFLLAANRPYHELLDLQGQFRNATPDALWRLLPAIDAEATETSVDHVRSGETYELRFRYRYKNRPNQPGPWTTRTHTVIGTTTKPADVPQFYQQGTRLRWLYPLKPRDFAGFEIREHTGLDRTWSNARPIHAGLISDSSLNVGQTERTTKTFLIKARDTTDNESANAAALTVNMATAAGLEFGDPLQDNVVILRDYALENFPGALTGASQVGAALFATDTGDLFWGADNALFWDAVDDNLFWDLVYNPLVYETEFAPYLYDGDVPLRNPVWRMLSAFEGEDPRLLYKPGDTNLFWDGLDSNLFWGADTDLFWPPDESDWVSWPGEITSPQRQSYPLRVEILGGPRQGKITQFQAELDVADIEEAFEDLVIAVVGTRLPVTQMYARIKTVSATLQDDGGAATSLKVIDKDRTGPLIKAYDVAGLATTARVDARIQGY